MTDEFYMKRALKLARKGESRVSPNPMVGAVIIKEDRIIGEGYHKEFGKAHAEINARTDHMLEHPLARFRGIPVVIPPVVSLAVAPHPEREVRVATRSGHERAVLGCG